MSDGAFTGETRLANAGGGPRHLAGLEG